VRQIAPRDVTMLTTLTRFYLLVLLLVGMARGENAESAHPWEHGDLTVETGLLWQVGTGTPLSYRFVQTQASWRSGEVFGKSLSDGSRLLLRHRITMIGSWVQQGPESHYVAFAGSPSIEWWNEEGTWALVGGSGGGFGLLDSQGVRGGQGQDFTLNWFARGGFEYITERGIRWNTSIMFQHMSNGGQTDPNPGIDAVGVMVGYTWDF